MQGVVRAVCAVIDAFHFLPPAEAAAATPDAAAPDAQQAATADAAAAGTEQADMADAHSDAAAEVVAGTADGSGKQEAVAAAMVADIRAALLKRVLPALSAQLVTKGDVRYNKLEFW